MKKISGFSALKSTLTGIVQEFEDQSGGSLSIMIAGLAQDFIPVDSGHMRKNTFAAKIGGKHYVITNAPYALNQYSGVLLHLWSGGRYSSISRSGLVPSPSADELKGLMGSDKRRYLYKRNYEYLKKIGALTRRKAEWFHRAARIALEPTKHELRKSFTVAARKMAKSGKYYKR